MSMLRFWKTEDGVRIIETIRSNQIVSVTVSFDEGATEMEAVLSHLKPDGSVELLVGNTKKYLLRHPKDSEKAPRYLDDTPLFERRNGTRW